MASLKNIKLQIQSYKKTGTVTHAMEAVSAVKMRKAQERALAGRAYAAAALSVLERVSGSADTSHHPLMSARMQGKTALIVVTSDKGLAGSLNSSVIRRAENELAARDLSVENTIIICLGRRGADHFASRGYDVRLRHENVSDDFTEADLRAITDELLSWHAAGEVATALVVYTNFVSTFEQEALSHQVIPVTPEAVHRTVTGIRPARGRYAPASEPSVPRPPATYVVEPAADAVLSVLLPQLINIMILHAFIESKASEHSARMVAMKSATDKAKDMVKAYTRRFNKARQAAITREVSEITSGMEAMR